MFRGVMSPSTSTADAGESCDSTLQSNSKNVPMVHERPCSIVNISTSDKQGAVHHTLIAQHRLCDAAESKNKRAPACFQTYKTIFNYSLIPYVSLAGTGF